MHDTVTMGFEFDHRSPVKKVSWYHMQGKKKVSERLRTDPISHQC